MGTKMRQRIPVSDQHISWLEQLMELEPKLTKWEQTFVFDMAVKIENGDMDSLSENQDGKLRQIAYDYLADPS